MNDKTDSNSADKNTDNNADKKRIAAEDDSFGPSVIPEDALNDKALAKAAIGVGGMAMAALSALGAILLFVFFRIIKRSKKSE